MRNHIAVSIMSLLLGSCVSVQLPGGKITPAKGVGFKAPSSPFKEFKSENTDKAWMSEKTSNTISFLSECGATSEPGLPQLENESLSALNNVQQIKTEELTFNGRAARLSTHKGDVDGVPVQLSLLVFKKNGCNYTLSYGGRASRFSNEESYFRTFIQSFEAP